MTSKADELKAYDRSGQELSALMAIQNLRDTTEALYLQTPLEEEHVSTKGTKYYRFKNQFINGKNDCGKKTIEVGAMLRKMICVYIIHIISQNAEFVFLYISIS